MSIPREITKQLSNDDLRAALNRADRIIGWMADYLGRMAPPPNGIVDLNEHWLFMERHGTPLMLTPRQRNRPATSPPLPSRQTKNPPRPKP